MADSTSHSVFISICRAPAVAKRIFNQRVEHASPCNEIFTGIFAIVQSWTLRLRAPRNCSGVSVRGVAQAFQTCCRSASQSEVAIEHGLFFTLPRVAFSR